MHGEWNDDDYVAFDLETTGEKSEYALQPWRFKDGRAWLTTAAWVWRAGGKTCHDGHIKPTVEQVEEFLDRAIAGNWTVVGWNVVYDIGVLFGLAASLGDNHRAIFEAKLKRIKWLDGMLVYKHYDCEPAYDGTDRVKRGYGLKKDAIPRFRPKYAGYEQGVDYHTDDPADLQRLYDYNIQDDVHTLWITRHLYRQLTPRQRQAVWIEMACLPLVAEANAKGMLVDTIQSHHLKATLEHTAAKRLEALAPDGMTKEIVRSTQKLAKLLFDDWKLKVHKITTTETGKKNRSTDKETLWELALTDKRAKLVREYRESLDNCGKFAERLIESAEYCDDGNFIHPSTKVDATYTGRFTISSKQEAKVPKVFTFKKKGDVTRIVNVELPIGWAAAQMKRGKEFRSQIIAPQGYDVVEFDAAAQEFRWMACVSGDPTMLGLCAKGEDAHSYMASRIYHSDYRMIREGAKVDGSKEEFWRKMGKLGNLCCIADTPILTNRGIVAIQDIRRDDRVWDGIEFVSHDGVAFSGVLPVISYDGLTLTPEHKVMVGGSWVAFQEAARHGWRIQSALGEGWAGRAGAAVRIVGGLVRRAVPEIHRAVRGGALRLGGEPLLRSVRDALCGPGAFWRRHPAPGVAGRGGEAQKLADHRGEAPCYDIVNCGPRTRFAANGRIVHNSLQYRTGPRRLRVVARTDYNIPMTPEEAGHIHGTYAATYIKVPEYWDSAIAIVKQRGYVETLAGRRVKVEGDWTDHNLAWKLEGTSINTPVQGTGADQKYLALQMLADNYSEFGARFMLDLHDGIYSLVPKAQTAAFVRRIQPLLNNLDYKGKWGYEPPAPMTWDCKVGPSWGSLRPYELN